jgi:catechol 2,3-dioxygenase-like lactoylglutathione lyase family enzyme
MLRWRAWGVCLAALMGAGCASLAGKATRPTEESGGLNMAAVNVRYIVYDVNAAVAFYTGHLGFAVERQPAPGFAILSRGALRLLLSASAGPGGSAQPMPDGRKPEPGGWNRIQLEVPDLASEVETLRQAGARFRNDIVAGFGGKQVLLDDPSGNPIELFEPPRK